MTRVSEYGSGTYTTDFEGVVNNLERRFKETTSDWMREEIDPVHERRQLSGLPRGAA